MYLAAVEMVRNGTVAAYMTQLTLLQYLVNQQPCDMAIVDSGWGYSEQASGNLSLSLIAAFLEHVQSMQVCFRGPAAQVESSNVH